MPAGTTGEEGGGPGGAGRVGGGVGEGGVTRPAHALSHLWERAAAGERDRRRQTDPRKELSRREESTARPTAPDVRGKEAPVSPHLSH